MYETPSCVIWKSESLSLLKATDEVKTNFELQAACLNYDFLNTYEKYIYFQTKLENQLIKVITYVSQTFKRGRALPYAANLNPISNKMGNRMQF